MNRAGSDLWSRRQARVIYYSKKREIIVKQPADKGKVLDLSQAFWPLPPGPFGEKSFQAGSRPDRAEHQRRILPSGLVLSGNSR